MATWKPLYPPPKHVGFFGSHAYETEWRWNQYYVTLSAKVCINLPPSSFLLCPCRCLVMMAPSGAVLLSHTAQNSPSTRRVLARSWQMLPTLTTITTTTWWSPARMRVDSATTIVTSPGRHWSIEYQHFIQFQVIEHSLQTGQEHAQSGWSPCCCTWWMSDSNLASSLSFLPSPLLSSLPSLLPSLPPTSLFTPLIPSPTL